MRTVFITGVSSGIGLSLAKAFVNSGYRVIGSVRSNEKALELKESMGCTFIPVIFDLLDHSEVRKTALYVKEILGNDHLSGIINNAGTAEIGPLLYVPLEDFRKQLEILVVSQLYIIQQFFRLLIPSDPNKSPGRIINISSVSGTSGNYFFGCYSASKHALEGMSKTLRSELKLFGIPVIVVAPGNINTLIWAKQTNNLIEKYSNTEYFVLLKKYLEQIGTDILNNSMTSKEFAVKFLKIFEEKEPAKRYTIKKKGFFFGKELVLVRRN